MTFITKLTLCSGDRAVLDTTVEEIAMMVSRKGAEMKGPHPQPPATVRVPLYKRLSATGGRFDPWSYTMYTRHIEIHGRDEVARAVASQSFPACVQVSAEIEQLNRH